MFAAYSFIKNIITVGQNCRVVNVILLPWATVLEKTKNCRPQIDFLYRIRAFSRILSHTAAQISLQF